MLGAEVILATPSEVAAALSDADDAYRSGDPTSPAKDYAAYAAVAVCLKGVRRATMHSGLLWRERLQSSPSPLGGEGLEG
jgi:hypothetical protein